MGILIKGGTVVTATESYRADVLLKDGLVDRIGRDLEAAGDEVIDANGQYVMPGAIDAHVHTYLRIVNMATADTFETSTAAAACGGTTTIIDYAYQGPGRKMGSVLERWRERATGKAVIDFGFHLVLTDFGVSGLLDEIPNIVESGVTSFKLFLSYKGSGATVDDAAMLRTLWQARDNNALVCIHCENADFLDALTQRALASGQTAPKYFALSRPPVTEGEATGRALDASAIAEAPCYIVHLSCHDALRRVRAARERGQVAFVETCPPYLLLSVDDLGKPGLEDAQYVTYPPLRSRADQDALWSALRSGEIQVIATDHAAYRWSDKIGPAAVDFTKVPGGAPSLEIWTRLIYSAGVATGRLSVNQFVALTATNPAKIFGMFPRKGTIAVGSDADVVVFDPDVEGVIRAKDLRAPADFTPFEGFRTKGRPAVVIARGEVVARNGEFVGRPGGGRFVKRGRPLVP